MPSLVLRKMLLSVRIAIIKEGWGVFDVEVKMLSGIPPTSHTPVPGSKSHIYSQFPLPTNTHPEKQQVRVQGTLGTLTAHV